MGCIHDLPHLWILVDLDIRQRIEEEVNVTDLIHRTQRMTQRNAPTILTGLGVSGTIATAYLAAKASFEASGLIEREQNRIDQQWEVREHRGPLVLKEKVLLVWKLYIPTGVSGALTIASIIGGTRASMKKTAAAYSLLSVSEKAFTEYKEKVVEQLGEKKEQAIRDEIAQDRMSKSPQGLVVVGAGNVLCYEMYTGRYFNSDMETLKKAQNEINAKMIRETGASLSDFYYMLGLATTSFSDRSGWDSCKLLELRFSTVMSEDNRPCIAFEYNYIEPF